MTQIHQCEFLGTKYVHIGHLGKPMDTGYLLVQCPECKAYNVAPDSKVNGMRRFIKASRIGGTEVNFSDPLVVAVRDEIVRINKGDGNIEVLNENLGKLLAA